MDFLRMSDAKSLVLRLNSLDNLYTHFWDHVLRAMKEDFLELHSRLMKMDLPDKLSDFDVFLHAFVDTIEPQQQVVWVFDDFGEINDRRVLEFIRLLAEMELENFRIVLISNRLASRDSIAFMSNNRHLLLGKELRFTEEEISELFRIHGSNLEPYQVEELMQYTEGWPLPLHLIALQQESADKGFEIDGQLTHYTLSYLFEEQFFTAFPKRFQKLTVKLSLLDSFTTGLAKSLYDGDNAELDMLDSHAFLSTEPSTGRFFFHHLYRVFLSEKQHLLNDDEERALWYQAALYYMSSGDTMDAIVCFRKSGDHIGMLNAISTYTQTQIGILEKDAGFFLEHLDLLTQEEAAQHPEADLLRALIYMNRLQLEDSEALLLELEKRFVDKTAPQDRELLGDVYVVRGLIQMMRSGEDFGDYFKKAGECLPNGSYLLSRNRVNTNNNHIFSMADNQPGARERMERAAHYGLPLMAKVMYGCDTCSEYLFSTEAAYLAYELEESRQHAYQAIYKAEANGQHDIVCNAYAFLARIGFLEGDLGEMGRQIQNIIDFVGKFELGILNDIRDTALAWYYIKVRDFSRTPRSIISMDYASRPVLTYGRVQIVHANYLINVGEYAKLVGMLTHPRSLFVAKGIRGDRICVFLMLAIGYLKLGNYKAAAGALWTAYDMSYNNGLTTLFIEAEDNMVKLAEVARRFKEYDFDPQWLDMISKQAKDFSKRAMQVRAEYKKQNPSPKMEDNPLTRREMEVLQSLALGMTREEIAQRKYVTVNTVKSFIRSIYNKLDAANRAEAVSIAIRRGYIDVTLQEDFSE